MGTTERALTSMKTRETKKQKRESAENRVQELKKNTKGGSRDQKRNMLGLCLWFWLGLFWGFTFSYFYPIQGKYCNKKLRFWSGSLYPTHLWLHLQSQIFAPLFLFSISESCSAFHMWLGRYNRNSICNSYEKSIQPVIHIGGIPFCFVSEYDM